MIDPIRKPAETVERMVEAVMDEATAPATILIVERDAGLRERLVERVRQQGYRADGAEDLREGVFLADEMAPDLVVVAVGAGGWEPGWALRVFRVLDMTSRIPIVGIVSDDVPADLLQGFEAVLPRAFAPYRLAAVVARVIAHAEEQSAGRLRVHELSLATPFPRETRFPDTPESAIAIHELEARLSRRGISWKRRVEAGEVVLSYALTVADAFALGYNATAADELRLVLEEAFPGLASESEALQWRIQDLERLWGVRRPPLPVS